MAQWWKQTVPSGGQLYAEIAGQEISVWCEADGTPPPPVIPELNGTSSIPCRYGVITFDWHLSSAGVMTFYNLVLSLNGEVAIPAQFSADWSLDTADFTLVPNINFMGV